MSEIREITASMVQVLFPAFPVFPYLEPTHVVCQNWLVGTQENEIETFCAKRGWSWHVAHVGKSHVLLWRDGLEALDEPLTCFALADKASLRAAMSKEEMASH